MEREIRIEESINLGESAGSPVYPELDPLEEAVNKYFKQHPSITLPALCADLYLAYLRLEEDLVNHHEYAATLSEVLVLETCLTRLLKARGIDWKLVEKGLKMYVENGVFA